VLMSGGEGERDRQKYTTERASEMPDWGIICMFVE